MTNAWHRLIAGACRWLYFHRVGVLHPELLPRSGPAVYLGLHRNGAVDGFVYPSAVPRATAMISRQLRKGPVGRLFFSGIEVVRDKDTGDRGANTEALERCVQHLEAGGELFIFPEGTSSLGPRHLPFKSGAARIILAFLDRAGAPRVVPLGATYESPWSFRSKVEVVVGEALSLDHLGEKPGQRLRQLKHRIETSLESVGINVESAERQREMETLACLATLGTGLSYHQALKRQEQGIPDPIASRWRDLQAELDRATVLKYQRVPLFPSRSAALDGLALLLVAPLVAVGAALNLVPLLAGYLSGRLFADDSNVVSLWRILVGVPCLALWVGAAAATSVVMGCPWAFGIYAGATAAGLLLYDRFKRLGVAVINALMHPDLRPRMVEFHRLAMQTLRNETA